MELRELKYFLAVAREGNMTAAANALHVTQPTLSRQMGDLEEELGARLFERKSHGVALTPDGMRLRERAKEIVGLVEKTRAEFAAGREIAGDVHIGGGETREMRHLAELMAATRADHPGVRFHIQSGNAELVTERLERGLLDFGILIQPVDLADYGSLPLPGRDVWGVVTRRDGELAARERLTRRDLLGPPLILSRQVIRRFASGNAFIDWFGEDFERLNVAATYNLVYNAVHMARCGLGHVVGLEGLADVSEGSGLCFRLLEPRLETALHIVWKKHRLFSPAAEAFFRKLRGRFGPAS